MTPDERVLRDHLGRGPFQSGVDRGWWRLVGIEWPHVLIAVTAAPREPGPEEYTFRFECTNYPQTEPTAEPWDSERKGLLDPGRWPTGKFRVADAFNPGWNAHALYLPCDRTAIQSHDGWRQQHPHMLWRPDRDITQYLKTLHDYLTSSDYTGPRCPPP